MPNSLVTIALTLLISGASAVAEPAKTSKERLSDKAADEQRVDNCGVAAERRGPTPRPDCPAPAPPAPAQPLPPKSR